MSDEEKKAIEDFKECYEKDMSRYEDFNTYTQYIVKRNELILNLIEKQSKEIEELKAHQIIFTNDYKPIGSKGRKFISEDTIKAKIEIRKEEKENCKDSIEEKYLLREIYVLQSLLEKE